jgi:hypothetical protein
MTGGLPVGLSGAVHSSLILLQVDEGDGELGEVGDVVVQQLGGLVHAGVEATVANLRHVGVVRRRDELFQIGEPGRDHSFKTGIEPTY